MLSLALGATVINPARSTTPRFIISNTGGVRFDLFKGPFTYDDSFIISPFTDSFNYIPNVPYSIASLVLPSLNGVPGSKKRSEAEVPELGAMPLLRRELCIDPILWPISASESSEIKARGVQRRQSTDLTLGYTTTDDFGTDGDDTPHLPIPYYPQPNYFQGNASFASSSPPPSTPVDLIFLDFIVPDVLSVLKSLGANYTTADISYYLPNSGPNALTTQTYLPVYAKLAWQAGVPSCPIG
jgi:hypothetical protein